MTHIWIPSKHQSAKNGFPKAPPQSELRKAHNKIVGVKHHNGQVVKDVDVLTEKFSFGLSPALLAEARESRPGKFLLQLLGCIDYAGFQKRPVMCVGRKVDGGRGGFRLTVCVPIDTRVKPGAVPIVGKQEDGVERTE